MTPNTESDKFEEGRGAYVVGMDVTENPYLLGTQDEEDWNGGWMEAESEDSEREEE